MTTNQPLGPEVLTPPAQSPTPHPLPGRTITLHPIQESHTEALWNLVGGTTDPQKVSVWTYLPEGPYSDSTYTEFEASIHQKTTSQDPLFYTILDNRTQKPQGWITLMSIVPEHLRLEIGNVLFAPELQRTTGATEAVYLLLRHAFEELGYRRVEWKCNDLNEGSKRAARRLGFVFEGVFREHMVVKGRNRDTAWFSLLRAEWEQGVKEGLEGWLHPGNFDETGKQRRGLEGMREASWGQHNTTATATAFLILDVQQGVTGQILDDDSTPERESYIDRLASVVKAARDKPIRIIHVKTAFRRGFPDLHLRNPSAQRVIPTGRYTEGHESVEFHPTVAPHENDIVTTKRRVSAFGGSDLEVVLRSSHIENLVVVGLITSGAVLSTVRQAADLDYGLTVLEDLCLDRDQEVHDVLMKKVIAKQADVVGSEEWLARL
ncbi:GNAT family acetyltransferase [Aspergillus bombycis]|uniref:GNAT family acetyltransferase n=1 Tax=Aspergillus bombycis TaxID=109264 RepID=A0A1F8A9X0_9EURO|nr:GNAT family acetyltransferase [Aspergillus bombycis]OGM48155.1 GNAT family acetyltransferase [Aspergillus bombycis]